MNIKKLGHCCLLIQTKGLTILTDPGNFSTAQNTVTGIDVVLITHEHQDHLHTDSLKEVLKHNPKALVVTNTGVGKVLDEIHVPYIVVEGRSNTLIQEVLFEAYDGKHEEIFEEMGQVQNTGYFVDNKLFYPGDSFCIPDKTVDVLALPVAGGWCRIRDTVRYALAVKPRVAFPVHDGMLVEGRIGSVHKAPEKVLGEAGVKWVVVGGDGVEV